MAAAHLELGAEVQIADGVTGTVAADAETVPIDDLDAGDESPKYTLVQIMKAAGTGDVTLPGPVKVIGDCQERRVSIGDLNLGDSIVISDDAGYQEMVQGIGLCTAVVVIPSGALVGSDSPAYDIFLIAVWGAA